MAANPEITVRVSDNGGPEEFGPIRSRDRQGCDHDCVDAVGAGLGDEAVEESSRREREEGFAVGASTDRADRAIPVADRESVLGLGSGLRVACEEPREERVGLGGKRVNGELSAQAPSQQVGVAADERAANRAGHIRCHRAEQVVDTFLNQL